VTVTILVAVAASVAIRIALAESGCELPQGSRQLSTGVLLSIVDGDWLGHARVSNPHFAGSVDVEHIAPKVTRERKRVPPVHTGREPLWLLIVTPKTVTNSG
jgi:hypothetical protein